MTLARIGFAAFALALAYGSSGCAFGVPGLLTAPKTLVDHAIEARSTDDIAKDNEIVLKVDAIMADEGTIKASTTIYEQRLIVTGIFDDRPTYERFENRVRKVEGVKKLYWHVHYMTDSEQKQAHLLDWSDVLVMGTKAQARLIGTAGVADVNFRTIADPTGTIYVIGRARSQTEEDKALARVRDGDGVKKVVSYVEVRP